MKKTIYVTGITGFIGKNLLTYLIDKFDYVANFTRRGTILLIDKQNTYEEPISKDFFFKYPSKTLINLATLYQQFPETKNELDDLVQSNILFPSMVVNELGGFEDLKITNVLSYSQLLNISDQNVYSLSKELFKQYLDHISSLVVNVYIFDTFGSGDTRNKVTDVFIKNILLGKSITIPKNEIKINLSDCNLVSQSLLKSIELKPGSYSVQSPDTISLEHLAALIMKILDTKVKVVRNNFAEDLIETIDVFPENIFPKNTNYSLENSLSKRIQEIKNELNIN